MSAPTVGTLTAMGSASEDRTASILSSFALDAVPTWSPVPRSMRDRKRDPTASNFPWP